MATHEVNIGGGRATGMFYHAPKNTALPTYPTETLAAAWKEVGYISADGITLTPFGGTEGIKDWSNTTRRSTITEKGTIEGTIISTTEESLKTLFGADSVTVTAASSAHGKLVNVEMSEMPGEEAFLFIGVDGDDSFLYGTTVGIITEIGSIDATPDGAIVWPVTIEGSWNFVKDDGQVTTG